MRLSLIERIELLEKNLLDDELSLEKSTISIDYDEKISRLDETLNKSMLNSGLGGAGSVRVRGAVLPTINYLPKPGNNSFASKIKIPSIKPKSTKNPLKSAEQTKNKDIKDIRMKEAQQQLVGVAKSLPNQQADKSSNLRQNLEKAIEVLEKRCWEGYEPTPGKKAYAKDSCQPIKKKDCDCSDCECNSVKKSKKDNIVTSSDNGIGQPLKHKPFSSPAVAQQMQVTLGRNEAQKQFGKDAVPDLTPKQHAQRKKIIREIKYKKSTKKSKTKNTPRVNSED
jgi:hypothetical protein